MSYHCGCRIFRFLMSLDKHKILDFKISDGEALNIEDVKCKYITENEAHNFFNFEDKNALNIMHVNCRSIKKNFGPLNDLLHIISGPLTAIAVTETWLCDDLYDIYNLPGYQFISKSRSEKSGGGIGIYVNNNLHFRI